MRLFAELIASVTGHPRERVVVKWDINFYVSFLFRAWEVVAWRRQGIKAETTSYWEDGKEILFVHSWEAAFCVAELKIREFFSQFKLAPFKIYIPMLATPQGLRIPASPYLFAIAVSNALQADNSNGGAVTITAGTNLAAFWLVQFFSSAPTTSPTLGGVAMSQSGSGQNNTFGGQIFYQANPATGSKILSVSGNYYQGFYITLSGVDQTSPIDNAGASHAGANGTSASVTVSASGCWMIGIAGFSGGNLAGVGNVFTVRFPVATTEPMVASSGGTIGTGSQTGSFTPSGGSSTPYIYISAIQPTASAGPTGVKTWDAVTQSTGVKTYIGVALASVKSVIGIS